MSPTLTDLNRLQRRKFVAEMFILGGAILAFGWIAAAVVLIFGDAELREHIFSVFGYLWLWLGAIPLCSLAICLFWRALLMRKIERIAKSAG
jgi:hypothetical protein